MKFLFVLGVIVAIVTALSENEQWAQFIITHAKRYTNVREEKLRFGIFKDNLRRIEEHNAKYKSGEVSYFFAVNQFADMTGEEFMSMLNSQINTRPARKKAIAFKANPVAEAPDSKDWRDDGAVTYVKDQGSCVGSWAFSATGALEAQYFIGNGELASFSEQQLLDCSTLNLGCQGGNAKYGFQYVADEGICLDDSYPYTGEDGNCTSCSTYLETILAYISVPVSEEEIKSAVGTVGPVSIGLTANIDWQLYAGGIFDDISCMGHILNHEALAVGYGNDSEDYWIIKNSWGTSWGEKGYIRLVRGNNQCGVSQDASFPLL